MEKDLMQTRANRGNTLIKGLTRLMAVLFTMAFMVGCTVGSGDDSPAVFEIQITSDFNADGDITFSSPNNLTVTSAATTGNVIAGVDPVDGDEFRGFFAFPLRGSQGVPLNAIIESATLELFVSGVTESSPGVGVPLIFDLVSFSPPVLIASDFDRTPLLSLYDYTVFADDEGFSLSFDVTPLMVEAQLRGLNNFQIRLLLDSAFAAAGFIEIEDSILATAPLLTVTYD